MKNAFRAAGVSFSVALGVLLLGSSAFGHAPLPRQHGISHGLRAEPATVFPTTGRWQALRNRFPGGSPDTALLLTDGTVFVHDACTSNWYKLKPSGTGSYANGAWSAAGSLPAGYTPLYFASQVLADGRVIMNGGEYNAGCAEAWTTLGALYDPVADSWTTVLPPVGWAQIGDSQSAVLSDGTYMLGDCCDAGMNAALAQITGTTVTWTATGAGKADRYDEEGWTNLPDGRLLTVDAWLDGTTNHSRAELYVPSTGQWQHTGSTIGRIEDPSSLEVGPAVLMANGKVLQIGANFSGTANAASHSSIYNPVTHTWERGPVLPNVGGAFYSAEDAPAALLPSGNVLVQLSPAYTCLSQGSPTPFCSPSHFWEYDGTKFNQVLDPPNNVASGIAAYESRMLVLPTGQIYWSSDVGDVAIYTPQGTPADAWRPTITSVSSTVSRGSTNNVVRGTLFNGLSQGASYGDDAQMSTNYPLVRITNAGTGHVCYARTHDHSRMGISTGGATSTKFDVPLSCTVGQSDLEVVANGIPSMPARIQVN
ncbi:MAG TPA: hypothetical protein VGG69_11145 [Rhizomicrobium sp.]|jgi:hypothetical protein